MAAERGRARQRHHVLLDPGAAALGELALGPPAHPAPPWRSPGLQVDEGQVVPGHPAQRAEARSSEISPRRRRSRRNSRPVLQATSVRSRSKNAPTRGMTAAEVYHRARRLFRAAPSGGRAGSRPSPRCVGHLSARRGWARRGAAGAGRTGNLTAFGRRASNDADMRLTGGLDRGRRLKAPAAPRTRPTAAKVREAIFNILGPPPEGRVLDLFAGTGALGLEALSRGARRRRLRRARPPRAGRLAREPARARTARIAAT